MMHLQQGVIPSNINVIAFNWFLLTNPLVKYLIYDFVRKLLFNSLHSSMDVSVWRKASLIILRLTDT